MFKYLIFICNLKKDNYIKAAERSFMHQSLGHPLQIVTACLPVFFQDI
jgi:hypothetical protein